MTFYNKYPPHKRIFDAEFLIFLTKCCLAAEIAAEPQRWTQPSNLCGNAFVMIVAKIASNFRL